MKISGIRAISAALLFAFYCMGMVVDSFGIYMNPENQIATDATKNQLSFSSASLNLYSLVSGAEKLSKNQGNNFVVDLKSFGSTPALIINAVGVLITSKFSQYIRYATCIFVQYRKADLIFPFHYFW